jgi:hypothetical protein
MKREWIISIVAICALSVVLVLLSQVSYLPDIDIQSIGC